MTNLCGSCTMCCKIMGVEEIPKPTNVWCKHVCKGKGCGIYDSRPQTCSDYECAWLTMKKDGAPIPDELRPDKSKVVINSVSDREDAMNVLVDPGFPTAWKRDDVEQFLCRIALTGIKVVVGLASSTSKVLIEKRGNHVTKRSITLTEPDEHGKQWYVPADQK